MAVVYYTLWRLICWLILEAWVPMGSAELRRLSVAFSHSPKGSTDSWNCSARTCSSSSWRCLRDKQRLSVCEIIILISRDWLEAYILCHISIKRQVFDLFLQEPSGDGHSHLALAFSSRSVQRSPKLRSCLWIFSLSCVSAVAAMRSPSARIISTVPRRSSSKRCSSCRNR